ncbi:hypothetical protein IR151_17575 [Clostridioides sp. ES-S-0006-03]|uniref:hypothetical protein n=1 Tax=Clostridioides sp. ES-S-0006-03 TaxID=2770775 RepID=UPI001D0C5777|nr:hypothetical protein [Clostridioides sp. ES-S-0006-03]
MNFICALNEQDKEILTLKGFKYIMSQDLGNHTIYMFENIPDNILNFSQEDKMKYLFTNKMYF